METLPEVTKNEISIRATAPELVRAAGAVTIWDEESANNAADVAKLISEALKIAEDERKNIVKPFNDGVKVINARFKTISEPLEIALAQVKSKLLGFRREQEQLRAKQAEAARLAVIESAAPVVAPPIAAVTKGQFGSAPLTKRWTFEVIDIEKVSRDLLIIDERKVRGLIADGARELPGIRIFQSESISIR